MTTKNYNDARTEKMKRIALVTGGVGGIGTAICKRLAADGHFVVANYAIPGSEEKWTSAMTAAGLNGSVSALAFGDVTDFNAMGEMVKKIEAEHGPIGILVNCAGITRDSTFRKMTPEQWRAVISTNLDSVFNVTRHVIEGMTERGWGRIINISSVNAVRGQFGQTNYASAKAGILGFTKSLAQEVVKKGVTVNSVSPGYVQTDMVRGRAPEDRGRDSRRAPRPAGGSRRCGGLPRLGGRRLHHRHEPRRERRPAHVRLSR